jgi:hypothetical protein
MKLWHTLSLSLSLSLFVATAHAAAPTDANRNTSCMTYSSGKHGKNNCACTAVLSRKSLPTTVIVRLNIPPFTINTCQLLRKSPTGGSLRCFSNVFIVLHNQSVSICINQQHDIAVLLNTGIKIKTTVASIQAQR